MAHKKGAGSTDNGRDSAPQYLGVKKFGGEVAKAGNILVRQRGTKFHAGVNVYMSKDHTLHASVAGVVCFKRSREDRRIVYIMPTDVIQEVKETLDVKVKAVAAPKPVKAAVTSTAKVAAPKAEPVVKTVDETPKAAPVVAAPKVEAKAEPVVEAKAEPVVEAVAEPVVEAKAEPVIEAVAEPVVEAKAEPVVEAVAEPVVEAKAEPVVEAPKVETTVTEKVTVTPSTGGITVIPKGTTTVTSSKGGPVTVISKGETETVRTSTEKVNVTSKGETETVIPVSETTSTSETVSASSSTTSQSAKADDLKKIEGIGPKIEELLHDAGIKTFAQLSETSAERVKEILDAAGPRYAIHNPATWAKQAELAAEGKWEELKTWQDELDGGKE